MLVISFLKHRSPILKLNESYLYEVIREQVFLVMICLIYFSTIMCTTNTAFQYDIVNSNFF